MHVRFKNRFGRRYMTDKEFLDYASDLNLLTDYPSSSLLEFTKTRIWMPRPEGRG
jgi:hypothetical protein